MYLLERHKEARELQDRRVARICALLYNINRPKDEKALTEDDFMPKPRKVQTPEQMLAQVKILHHAFTRNAFTKNAG
jgi:hypothetical protein